MTYRLFCRPGWGSVIVEAQLAWYGLPIILEEVGDLFEAPGARAGLEKINPLAQLPTLVLPDGTVMTESAAITLLLSEITGEASLVPAPGSAERATFLRWLVFMVANVYPTFTYADVPARFVSHPDSRADFRNTVDQYRLKLLTMVEAAAGSPWFLGDRFSALDIYVATITRWRPGRTKLAELCPNLHALALRADVQPRLTAVWNRNYPEP